MFPVQTITTGSLESTKIFDNSKRKATFRYGESNFIAAMLKSLYEVETNDDGTKT